MVVRVCRVVTILLLVALPLLAQTAPPSDLRLVRGHWTAYSPPDPAVYPPGSEVHIIERGDTLWDLARRYYGDPYLWPQLWENNTYITDAHWIYPGDPLLIRREGVVGEIPVAEIEAIFEEEPAFGFVDDGETLIPFALGHLSDVYCFGYLGHVDEPYPNRIAAFEDTETRHIPMALYQEIGVTVDDIVFLEGGTATGLIPGETYLVVRRDHLVTHPVTGEVIGRHYDYRGRIRILCAEDDIATGIVVQACSDILVDDRLKPMPQIPIPLAELGEWERHCTIPSGKSEGFIVNAKDYHYALGEGAVVQVNLGFQDAVEPGDFLTVYRPHRTPGFPRLILGEIGILTTEAHSATGRIIRMSYSMEVGDRVELK
jgi:hypothetical protein